MQAGATADVYRAKLGELHVALQVVRRSISETASELRKATKELKGQMTLMLEFCEKGSLFNLLHSEQAEPLDALGKLRLAKDIADGLHSKNIVQKDVKSLNILVDGDLRAKVADFGSSRSLSTQSSLSTQGGGTTPGCASPEVFLDQPITFSSDVYSLGCTLWELESCAVPWEGVSALAVGRRVTSGNQLQAQPEWRLAELVGACLSRSPRKRPTAALCSSMLATLMKQELSYVRDDCLCPISFAPMVDPVMAADDHSYERAAIQDWFERGNRTSPMTGAALRSSELRPNVAMRKLIESLSVLGSA